MYHSSSLLAAISTTNRPKRRLDRCLCAWYSHTLVPCSNIPGTVQLTNGIQIFAVVEPFKQKKCIPSHKVCRVPTRLQGITSIENIVVPCYCCCVVLILRWNGYENIKLFRCCSLLCCFRVVVVVAVVVVVVVVVVVLFSFCFFGGKNNA